jgi:hypothetical protein
MERRERDDTDGIVDEGRLENAAVFGEEEDSHNTSIMTTRDLCTFWRYLVL